MRLVFNPMTASLDWVDLPAGVKYTRDGNVVSLYIDSQEVAQWEREAIVLTADDGTTPLTADDGSTPLTY